MDVDKSNLSEVFSGVAPRYDLLNHVLSFYNDTGWRKELVSMTHIGEGAKILDLCTGTADIAVEFAKRQRSCRVFGIDFSQVMLQKAAEKIKRLGLGTQISLIEADVFGLPFKAGYFDIVSIGFGLRNLIDYRKGFTEMVHMLKEGGRVIILEFAPPPRGAFGRMYHFYLKNMLPFIANLLGGSLHAYHYLSSSIHVFPSPQQVLRDMGSSGLKNLYRKELAGGIIHLYYGKKISSCTTAGVLPKTDQ